MGWWPIGALAAGGAALAVLLTWSGATGLQGTDAAGLEAPAPADRGLLPATAPAPWGGEPTATPPPLPALGSDAAGGPNRTPGAGAARAPAPGSATDAPSGKRFSLKVGQSKPLTAAQKRELAIAARRKRRAALPGKAADNERLEQVKHDEVAPDELPDDGAAGLDGVYELEDDEAADVEEGVTTAVTGVVLDASTEAPIHGAHVALFSAFYKPHIFYDRQLSELGGGVTDAEGRFVFTAVNLDDLHYRGGTGLLLVITHPTVAGFSGAPPVTITEGLRNDLGTFRLEPTGIVWSGQVRDLAGAPLADLLVTVSPDNPVNVSKPQRQVLLQSLPHAVTDGDGRWRIGGLRPGKVWLSVHRGLDGVLFQEVEVTASRDDLNLRVRVGGTVTGRIVDRSGNPIASARIDGAGNTTHSLADGTFLLENFETSKPFTVSVTHHASYPRQVADIRDGQRDLEIMLEPLPTATLVVRRDGDFAPIPELELLYTGPPAVLAQIPTSPYRRSATGEYHVILYPKATAIRVFRQGFAEQHIALGELAAGARREVVLQPPAESTSGG